ncbi:hypothetical protein NBRC116590_10320 [Pelagimonas sp. KU-00592-HH]|uniref:hypothetical protein n=1 Tax=Pelagimonas sp. KU-00592-HH TaxID=3127651 RepID=UPI003101BD4D
MDEINSLLGAVENQVELLMSMATFGFGGVLFVFLRSGGLIDEAGSISRFKLLGFLATPIVLFFLALLAGLFSIAQIQGFFQEVALDGQVFRDLGSSPQELYDKQYKITLGASMVAQMVFAVLGYLLFVIWFLVNMYDQNSKE